MTWRDRKLSCARAEVLLEAALDGELRREREEQLRAHLRACTACREVEAGVLQVQAGLRALPRWSCPPAVVQSVLDEVGTDSGRRAGLRRRVAALAASWAGRAVWRPALAAASVLALALAIAVLARQPVHTGPAAGDLVRAEQEARWALAYVAEVTQRAAMASVGEVVEGVIGTQVIVPVTDAVQKPLVKDQKPREEEP